MLGAESPTQDHKRPDQHRYQEYDPATPQHDGRVRRALIRLVDYVESVCNAEIHQFGHQQYDGDNQISYQDVHIKAKYSVKFLSV